MRATLTYHSIDDSGSPISVAPAAFEAHLRWLTSGRVAARPLDDLVAADGATDDAVAVTFDDGFRSAAEPIRRLLAVGVPVTIFVAGRHVGGTNAWGGRDEPGIPTLPLMDWDELGRLAEAGADIASHTLTHPHLTTLAPAAIDDELHGGVAAIAEALGLRSRHLAYPYGDVDATVMRQAADVYTWAHTTDFRLLAEGQAPLALPRLDMYYFQRSGALEAWGTARFGFRLAGIRARRAVRARLLAPRSGRPAGDR